MKGRNNRETESSVDFDDYGSEASDSDPDGSVPTPDADTEQPSVQNHIPLNPSMRSRTRTSTRPRSRIREACEGTDAEKTATPNPATGDDKDRQRASG
ncbi:UNVERIFIED_CONTAM: hypothetical protein K2H54_020205 [Gekko kuhli]